MVEAERNHTRDRDLPPPSASSWVLMPEVFSALTLIVGDPEEAVHDMRRELLSGQVRSLRRRSRSDDIEDRELDRSFWRDIKLYADKDRRGRDVVGLRLKPGVEQSTISKCTFYLHRADCLKTWPKISISSPAATPLRTSRGNAEWIADEAKRMKRNNEIPADIRILQFAKLLAERLNDAARTDRSLRPMKAKSIENKLRDWGLWPVTSIR
jgi:hypothetical protein